MSLPGPPRIPRVGPFSFPPLGGLPLHTLDFAVVCVYFAFTLGLVLWVARRQRSAADYFLGARDLPAWAILLSIVATETSALTVISIPGIGARGDFTFLQLTVRLPGRPHRRGALAAARLFPRRAGDRLRPPRDPVRRHTRRLTSVVFLVTRFLGRCRPGVRQRDPARTGHRLERADVRHRDGHRHDGLYLVRRVQGGRLDRRAPALRVPGRRRRRAADRLGTRRWAGASARAWRPTPASSGSSCRTST